MFLLYRMIERKRDSRLMMLMMGREEKMREKGHQRGRGSRKGNGLLSPTDATT